MLRPSTKMMAAARSRRSGRGKSTGHLAAQAGSAPCVGLANGANPIAIVIPCHRVIGANASLTGYGGGLDRKRWLLMHESAFSAPGGVQCHSVKPYQRVDEVASA